MYEIRGLPLSQDASLYPRRTGLLIAACDVRSASHTELSMTSLPRVQPEKHTDVHRDARKRGTWVRSEADGGQRPRAHQHQRVDGLQAHDGVGEQRPYVLGQALADDVKQLRVVRVAAGCDEDDDPEEGRVGFIALVGVFLPQDGDERVEGFQILVKVPVHIYAVEFVAPEGPRFAGVQLYRPSAHSAHRCRGY